MGGQARQPRAAQGCPCAASKAARATHLAAHTHTPLQAEHSLELHTPYIVAAMGGRPFKLVPIMVGALSTSRYEREAHNVLLFPRGTIATIQQCRISALKIPGQVALSPPFATPLLAGKRKLLRARCLSLNWSSRLPYQPHSLTTFPTPLHSTQLHSTPLHSTAQPFACREAEYGALLAPYLADPANCFVISSDFCHWGSRFSYTFYDKSQASLGSSHATHPFAVLCCSCCCCCHTLTNISADQAIPTHTPCRAQSGRA